VSVATAKPREPMIPYCTSDMEWEACKRLAAELWASGRYSAVTTRRREPEGTKQFGRIYVRRVQP
jgi:uncharacterized protein YraI